MTSRNSTIFYFEKPAICGDESCDQACCNQRRIIGLLLILTAFLASCTLYACINNTAIPVRRFVSDWKYRIRKISRRELPQDVFI
ncbi:unnamed protein product [Caenorhabditis auriculariae]|uniref:Uncharacterized protein n=1 Tax=Caenorhabditis auriculariae TaxID=2777116 RepID=A0A8S1HTL2_9PELO|nr:unnamed protein product [Caenorhabditis auriculariae]